MWINKWLRRGFYFFSYLRKPPWDTGISPPELMEFIHTHPPGTALDLGCGTGTNIITLARHGWQVTGIDFIPTAIRTAQQKVLAAGIKANLSIGDVSRLDHLKMPFDLILDIGCYHHLDEPAKIAYESNIQRLLLPTGTFLLYGFMNTIDSEFGIREIDLQRLNQMLLMDYRQDGSDRHRASAWFCFQKLP
jgi:2-polyprenyl-3-methyl-5-hydroxy-6-metoxy-1,4-benzoquinol methylase